MARSAKPRKRKSASQRSKLPRYVVGGTAEFGKNRTLS